MIDAHLYSFLNENAELTALVSGRIYPMRLPQGSTADSIVYEIGDGFPDRNAVLTTHYITINSYSTDYDRMRGLCATLSALFQSYHGTIGTLSVASCGVQNSINTFEEEPSLYRNILTINLKTN